MEMFGDPIKNSKNSPLVKLKDICKLITVGIVVKPASYYVPKGVPALRGVNIRKNGINLNNLVYVSEENNKSILSKSIIKERDVLVVRSGYPGTACIVPKNLDGVNCIIKSEYLCNHINSDKVRNMILSSQTGSAQKHFNIGAVNKLNIPLPPIEIQNEFTNIIQNIEKLKKYDSQSNQQINDFFNVLLQKAFRGELVC